MVARRKKSSEEQWRAYEASVRGAAPRSSSVEDVLAAARRAPPEAWFGDKVFLSAVLPYVPAAELLRLQQQGAIVLHRADMVSAFDAELVRRSEISPGGYVTYHFLSVPETEQRAMRPNRTPRLHHGRADQLTRRVYWQESGEGDWTNVTLGLHDVDEARYLGPINLEDSAHAVFRLADGRTVAQVTDMHRNHKGLLRRNAALQLRRGLRILNVVHPDWGTWVVLGQERPGIWNIRGVAGTRLLYEDDLAEWRKCQVGDFGYQSNASPPPPPRRRRTDTSLRRVRSISEEHERREKPFDPSIGYERGTKPHHFALNPRHEWEPFRDPDAEVSLSWAVWYGPGGVDGDVATEVELDGGSGIYVREYNNVVGTLDEGSYDESEPFLVLETYLSADDIERVALAQHLDDLHDAMSEPDDPDEFTIVPDDDDARLLILRYAATIGVKYIGERGGEESWAAELPR